MNEGRKEVDKELEKLEKRLQKEYKDAKEYVQKKLNKHLESFQKKDNEMKKLVDSGAMSKKDYIKWRKNQMLTGKRWEAMRDSLAQDLTNIDKIAMDIISDRLPDICVMSANYGMFEIEKGIGVDTSFTLYDRGAVKALVTKPILNIRKDYEWNRQKVTSAITQGVLAGDSIPNIAKRLQQVTDMDRQAAIRNARTYTTSAESAGKMESFKYAESLGIKVLKQWETTPDGRARDSHIDVDGEKIPLDATFSNGLTRPGDTGGPPEEVYNCRCGLIPYIEGHDYSKEERFMNLPEGITYDEWKEAARKRLEEKKRRKAEKGK